MTIRALRSQGSAVKLVRISNDHSPSRTFSEVSAVLRVDHEQTGSYQLARRISTEKRAWSHAFPGTHLILELSRYADLQD